MSALLQKLVVGPKKEAVVGTGARGEDWKRGAVDVESL